MPVSANASLRAGSISAPVAEHERYGEGCELGPVAGLEPTADPFLDGRRRALGGGPRSRTLTSSIGRARAARPRPAGGYRLPG